MNGNMNYNFTGNGISTVKGNHEPIKFGNEKLNFDFIQPRSVKHSSKPSTASSSLVRHKAENTTGNNKAAWKINNESKFDFFKFQQNNKGNSPKAIHVITVSGKLNENKNKMINFEPSFPGTSVYLSRLGKKITELKSTNIDFQDKIIKECKPWMVINQKETQIPN